MPETDRAIIEMFLEAYRHGAFPMAESGGGAVTADGARSRPRRRPPRIDWFIPDPRAIIELHAPSRAPQDLGGFHISRSLARRLRSTPFRLTSDIAFEQVIRACAEPTPGRPDSWIDERLITAYVALHQAGFAHSVEAWLPAENTLVGGVYGVAIGSAFCAESMFCRPELGGTDASKVALAYLVRHIRSRGFTLLDVQLRNHHTDQFGVVEIPDSSYQARLAAAIATPATWGNLQTDWPKAPST